MEGHLTEADQGPQTEETDITEICPEIAGTHLIEGQEVYLPGNRGRRTGHTEETHLGMN